MWKGSLCLVASSDFHRMFFLAFFFQTTMKCIGATSWQTNRKLIGFPCHALHYFSLRQPSCSNQLVCQSPAILYTTGSAMVSIKEAIAIHCQEEKPVLTPHSIILHHEGQKYLKVRPTSQPIICLLHGGQPKRNASLPQLEPLRQLIEARNQEIKKVHCEDPGNHGNSLLDQQEADPPAKKQRIAAPSPSVVTITVGDQLVDCLVSGKRPARSDLAVLLEPDHLDPVICHLRPSTATALEQPTRSHKTTK